jgi:leucyl-tRNA---protein transferase
LTHDAPFAELEIEGAESPCSYLPGQTARMVYRLAYRLAVERYEQLLSRGWRRFGRTLFRPVCQACQACQSLRVRIPDFQPSKSQRRCLAANCDIDVIIQRPTLSDEHIELYNRFHSDMQSRRNWPHREIDADQYAESFLEGQFSFAREFQYRRRGELVGLGLVDVTSHVMSSIYFFHEPALRSRALGTYSVLRELADGRMQQRAWLYMGYYIRDCGSMNYKNRFRPHEILRGGVPDTELPHWESPTGI